MASGLSAVNLANKWLNILRGAAFTPPAGVYARLHLDDPGPNGTANASVVATRIQVAYSPAANGAIVLTGTNPQFTMTATETIKYVSFWDDATAGNFLWSAPLAAPRNVVATDTLTLVSAGVTLGPLAA
ncbi:gp34 protein [Mycobacteroides abscessus subsp. abscessus]|uniref:Gp34 protein n=2 Tax=Mycobacteroides abscessus TaxID=36809 RepID=A0AB38CVG4_9MYCO|nr:hypothetical protein DDJ46_15560 [Mycobacteroides abscessus]SHP41874.1 gp34 protein [Mycobacteroides abscessus subsp. abscessus]SKM05204.1 gp34 protein [Mycobacteroides abscessus subsp. massiliense]SLD44774.1 gp34 protein [Mycobacteroides abscessus subsp. bolletii]SHS17074.1 gp34 protein [Mycobacteroides abscessus subsp. abscessus]